MFENGIIVLIGVSLIFWLRRSKGASQCSGCSGCSYQRPDASEESTVDLSFSLDQLTLDRVKSGKYCRIGKINQTSPFGDWYFGFVSSNFVVLSCSFGEISFGSSECRYHVLWSGD